MHQSVHNILNKIIENKYLIRRKHMTIFGIVFFFKAKMHIYIIYNIIYRYSWVQYFLKTIARALFSLGKYINSSE